jgi:hypothetical protein
VLAVSFDVDGEHLWSSGYAMDTPSLRRTRLAAGSETIDVTLPALPDDAVAYIAQNPARPAEVAIATFKRNIFVSPDLGRSWTQIVIAGATKP